MKTILLALSLVAVSLSGASASPLPDPELSVAHERNVLGKVTTLTLSNEGSAELQLTSPWVIVDRRTEEQVSHYDFSDEELVLAPGEQVVWEWMQDDACYGICRNVRAGEPVGAGLYESIVEAGDDRSRLQVGFQLGRYFTVGFRCNDTGDCDWDPFVVYVNTPNEVAQMEAEAAAGEKTLIVSGIVRSRQPYNPNWKFAMRPGSIVLGEVFIEVCDGSPRYVQQHRDEWFGDRWCPWSSYVEKVGR